MGLLGLPASDGQYRAIASTLLFVILAIQCFSVSAAETPPPEKTAADYFIHSLPGAPEPLLKMHAGHIEVNAEHHGNLFFWLFHNRHIAEKQRTVIWLNGGPGCSSMDGALMEVGPYRVTTDGNLIFNEGSWDEFTNLVFVDNPAGTGFSYVDTDSYVHELDDMANQFIVFLEKFFALFPELEHDELYFAGESYAGQYIPYVAQAILKRNGGMVKHKWRLAGLLIGNGWISPVDHYMSYLPFAYEEGLLQGGSEAAKRIESQVAVCTNKLSAGGDQHVDESDCEKILWDILDFTKKPDGKEFTCYNMYDVRLTDTYSDCGMNWPPDLVQMTPYLRKPEVKAALHVNSEKRSGWVECSGNVGDAFRARKSVPSIQMLPAILETVPIVLFSGAKDMICNHLGTEQLIHNMEWNGGKGFELNPGTWAPRRDWTFEGEPAGYYQEARNLTYVLFYNSSHMVPFDYPRRTRDMLDRFLKVDIASIGGAPAESRIDGEKGMETSVGGHPNSTIAEEEEKEKLEKAKWHAYYKSGEVALVIVIIAAGAWGWYVWRDRQRTSGYQGLFGGSNGHVRFGRPNGSLDGGMGLESFRHKAHGRDVEAAEFDESQLDELHVETPVHQKEDGEMEQDRYSIGGASSDEDASTERREGKRPDR